MSYVVRVRALAELGTEEACAILEKQLQKVIIDDPVEQSWYWIDIAHCLRMLAHDESVPLLLELMAQADDFPLVHFYAAELVAFNSFSSFLKDFPERHGEAAVRALHRALEGLRCGISAQIVAEARLGEMLDSVWDQHKTILHPMLVRLFSEVLRHQRRAHQYSKDLAEEHFEQEAYEMQVSHLAALEDDLIGYLADAKRNLPRRTEITTPDEIRDWLEALQELRADAGVTLVKLLRDNPNLPLSEQAILTLGWSKAPQAAAFLRETIARSLSTRAKPNNWWPWWRKPASLHQAPVAAAALIALRNHPGEETEQLLLAGARSADTLIRSSAISSLGWWEPIVEKQCRCICRMPATMAKGQSATPPAPPSPASANGKLCNGSARGSDSENRHIVMESIQAIADEGITLLWPELDRLVDEEEPELASCRPRSSRTNAGRVGRG